VLVCGYISFNMIILSPSLFIPIGFKGPRCITGFCSISYVGSVVLLDGCMYFLTDYQTWFSYGFLSTIEL